MNIYLLKRTDDIGWDEYKSCIVCAENEEEARSIHPNPFYSEECAKQAMRMNSNPFYQDKKNCREYNWNGNNWDDDDWVAFSNRNELKVELLGVANKNIKKGVLDSNYNAG